MSDFVHLQVHSEYSLLSSLAGVEEVCRLASELGMRAVAITDKNNMFSAPQFYDMALRYGIKPIIGCELSVRGGAESGPLICLCKNERGYHSLSYLVSRASYNNQHEPYVTRQELFAHSSGLIVLVGMRGSSLCEAIMGSRPEEAKRDYKEFLSHFGEDNVYLQISRSNQPEHEALYQKKLSFARLYSINTVATNEVCFLHQGEAPYLEVLRAIKEGKRLEDLSKETYSKQEAYLKSAGEMRRLFQDLQSACDNTLKIVENCNFEFNYRDKHLPEYPLAEGLDVHEYLREKCIEGLKTRYGIDYDSKSLSPREGLIKQRLDYELSVVADMGYSDYFLICWDYVKYAKSRGILVGAGRGSGGASLICYVLRITDIDPIEYKLIFERFLNPERISMPDLDIDFQDNRRHEVIDYVLKKYGSFRVAQIITFGTLSARQVIRDVARVSGLSQADTDLLAKAIPNRLNITLDAALEEGGEFKRLYIKSGTYERIINVARKLEGLPRHISTHAAGVVIAKEELYKIHPVIYQDGLMLTQYDMNYLEKLGLLKMDFLGLRYLNIIAHTLEEIERTRGLKLKLEDIGLDDKKTYALLSKGLGLGVFQLESPGMIKFMKELRPYRIEDLIIGISLYRPGPMESIPKFLEYRRSPSKIKYASPELKTILAETSGCIVYQEQVMEIVRVIGGFTYGEADNLRRAMSKKKMQLMQDKRRQFIYGKEEGDGSFTGGGLSLGMREETLNQLYDEMTEFANYAFNKAHATGYAVIAYYTAYLKANYPREYMAALLSSVTGSLTKVAEYIKEASVLGIRVLAPNILKSRGDFIVEGAHIRYGLSAIKNVGRRLVEDIERLQDEGRLGSLAEFYKGLSVNSMNKKSAESLILSGALSSYAYSPSCLLGNFEAMYSYYKPVQSLRDEKQLTLNDVIEEGGLLEDYKMEPVQELSPDYIDKKRLEFLGVVGLGSLEEDAASIYIRVPKMTSEEERYLKSLVTHRDGSRLLIYDESSAKLHRYREKIVYSSNTETDFYRRYGRDGVKIVLPVLKNKEDGAQ